MNFALSDEQEALRDAARDALSRVDTVAAARTALEDWHTLPDLWKTAVDAGWPGLLIAEDRGGAGLGTFDALLVAEECGRVLASVPLLGLLPATYVLDRSADSACEDVASGEVRPVLLAARPPAHPDEKWSVDPASGLARAAAPTATVSGETVTLSGTVSWVPDAPGADLLVVVGQTAEGDAVAAVVEAGADGVSMEALTRYDATRALGHVTLDGAEGRRLSADAEVLANAWYLGQALIAAESLGTVQTCLDVSVAYAKERFTFGRAIGSYQAIKHELTEVLRQLDNTRSLQYYAGWAGDDKADEFPLAASAARNAGGHALDTAARTMIQVHGGIGATWEHDAPLFFRRAQLSRRLLGGTHDAADRVASHLLAGARVSAGTEPAIEAAGAPAEATA